MVAIAVVSCQRPIVLAASHEILCAWRRRLSMCCGSVLTALRPHHSRASCWLIIAWLACMKVLKLLGPKASCG